MANFNKMFMRPNFNNAGEIPMSGTCCFSPDICCTGTSPLNDYQKELVDHYSKEYNLDSQSGQTNYFYLRCKNNSDKVLSSSAYLYCSPAAALLWPSNWISNTLQTDTGDSENFIPPTPAGGIGVVSRPFVWLKTPNPPTNDHYCLIARLTDEADPNPLPGIHTSIDLSNLISNNLRYAQRNVNIIENHSFDVGIPMNLDIPADNQDSTRSYSVTLTIKNGKGWGISMNCSQHDSDGKEIAVAPTVVDSNDRGYSSTYRLEAGFHALATVYLKAPAGSATNPVVDLTVGYNLSFHELERASALCLINPAWNEMLNRTHRGPRDSFVKNIRIGAVSAVFKD